MALAKRKCMTCRQDFTEGDPGIFRALDAFDDTCICWACVKVYRKEVAPEPNSRE